MRVVSFVINDRFTVNAATNVVVDREAGASTRIEPRHMKMLCALVEHEGQLVERSTLIEQIWNNYGGADDALTQAISYLRKLLHDDDKRVIETVPKSGYILHAGLAPLERAGASTKKDPRIRTGLMIAGGLVVLVVLFWFLRGGDPVAPAAPVDASGDHEEAIAPEAP